MLPWVSIFFFMLMVSKGGSSWSRREGFFLLENIKVLHYNSMDLKTYILSIQPLVDIRLQGIRVRFAPQIKKILYNVPPPHPR